MKDRHQELALRPINTIVRISFETQLQAMHHQNGGSSESLMFLHQYFKRIKTWRALN